MERSLVACGTISKFDIIIIFVYHSVYVRVYYVFYFIALNLQVISLLLSPLSPQESLWDRYLRLFLSRLPLQLPRPPGYGQN